MAFADFIEGLLKIDPSERWTAEQASHHPFVMNQPFAGSWTPPSPKKVAPIMGTMLNTMGPASRSPPSSSSQAGSLPPAMPPPLLYATYDSFISPPPQSWIRPPEEARPPIDGPTSCRTQGSGRPCLHGLLRTPGGPRHHQPAPSSSRDAAPWGYSHTDPLPPHSHCNGARR